jgi:hypothetical protein
MMRNILAFAAPAAMAATPCIAAEIPNYEDHGARRSAASAGLYFKVPLSGRGTKRVQAGLHLAVTHDYRSTGAVDHKMVRVEAFDLRLVGDDKPTLYVAGQPIVGEDSNRSNLRGVATILVLIATAVLGIYIIVFHANLKSNDEEE